MENAIKQPSDKSKLKECYVRLIPLMLHIWISTNVLQCGQQIQTEHSLIKHAAHPANLQHRKRLRRRNAHPIYIAFFTENKNRVLNICSTIFKDHHHHHCSWAVCWQITAENRGEWKGILVFVGRRVRPSHIQTIQEFVRHRCFWARPWKSQLH